MLQADLDSLQSWSDTWLLKLEAGQIGPKPNRPIKTYWIYLNILLNSVQTI
jgi:hypothetical protein